MNLADVWSELESGAPANATGGWIVRRIRPDASFDVRLGIENRTSSRAFLVRVLNSAVSSRIEFPSARGFECKELPLDDCPPTHTTIGVILSDPLFSDVFSSLIEDVLVHLGQSTTESQVVASLIERLKVWRYFMEKSGAEGLSKDAQKGLYGELYFLREFLLSPLGPLCSVQAWVGPLGAAQDFQWNRKACEVKVSSSKQHLKFRVSNELQLDSSPIDKLWLYFLSVDSRPGSGETLQAVIDQIRNVLAGTVTASQHFSNLLLQAGYHVSHADRYSQEGYSVRESFVFHVREGFPRIVEADLMSGVGDVSYSVLISECLAFRETENDVRDSIGRQQLDSDQSLREFCENLQQEVLSRASLDDQEAFIGEAFTRVMIDYLSEAGEVDDGEVCFHKARGIEVSGFHLNDDEDELDLFVTICTQSVPPATVSRTEVDARIKRLLGFLRRSIEGYYSQLEEASPVFDMALRLYEARQRLERVRLYVLSDAICKAEVSKPEALEGLEVSISVWDIERLHRCVSSGQRREPIAIDFMKEFGEPIPCLEVPSNGSDYRAFLAIIPGNVLAKLYGQFGPRLLELNVRSFLQARGKVNKGIKETIVKQPERFLAYNNGITATGSEIKVQNMEGGGKGISWIRDFQIVNGGQTTASIYQTAKKDGIDPSSVHVQAKISVVDPEFVDEIVPLISRFANSQNKVNDADFSANDPFHVQLEKLSRTVWAPAADGTQRQTRWFYERARGQYQDAKAREATPARKREFSAVHPNKQMFTKTDLAKFENTWNQLPHKVSFGAQKNFREFTILLNGRKNIQIDQQYFERLVAKAILFRRAEKIVSSHEFGGYRANIVTYSLAWLSHRTGQRLNLDEIWKLQDIPPPVEAAIDAVCQRVHHTITHPPGGRNITEWCKRDACWDKVRELEIDLPEELKKLLVSLAKVQREKSILKDELSTADKRNIKNVAAVSANTWFELSRWAKQTENLQSFQRGIAYSLGRLAGQGREPSKKQAEQGMKILAEAKRLGFVVSE